MLTTDQKGAIAETAIVHEATKLGIEVYRPIAEGGRFDMIFFWEHGLTVFTVRPLLGDVIAVRTCSSRRAREGIRKRSRIPPLRGTGESTGINWAEDFDLLAATLAATGP